MVQIDRDTVWQALKAYSMIRGAGQTALANASVVQDIVWRDGELSVVEKGYGVRGVLLWAIQQLEVGNQFEQQSAEILRLRYVDGLSVAQCQVTLQLSRDGVNKQQRKAIERITSLLLSIQETGTNKGERVKLTVQLIYDDCEPLVQHYFRFLSILEQPIEIQAVNDLLKEPLSAPPSLLIKQAGERLIELYEQARPTIQKHLSIDEYNRWHGDVARYYGGNSRYDSAIYHAQRAGLQGEAADWLIVHWRDLTAEQVRERLEDVEMDALDTSQQTQIKLIHGHIALSQQNVQDAKRFYEGALQTADTPFLQATSCYHLGYVYKSLNGQIALRYYRQGQAYLMQNSDEASRYLLVQLKNEEIWVLIVHKNAFEEAQAKLEEIESFIDPDWHLLKVDVVHRWATFYLRQHDRENCLEHRWQAWFLACESGDLEYISKIGYALAGDLAEAEQFDEAIAHIHKLHAVAEESEDYRLMARCEKRLGECLILQGKVIEQALLHYQRAYDFFVESADYELQSALCYDLAETYLLLERPIEAHRILEKGLTIAEHLDHIVVKNALRQLADSHPALKSGLSERQRLIVAYAHKHGRIQKQACVTLLDVSERHAVRELNTLIDMGILERFGRGRGIYYSITTPYLALVNEHSPSDPT